MTNQQAKTILHHIKELTQPDFQKAWNDFQRHIAEYTMQDRTVITTMFRIVSKQKNPHPKGIPHKLDLETVSLTDTFIQKLHTLTDNQFGGIWNIYLSAKISVPRSKVEDIRRALYAEWMRRHTRTSAKRKNPCHSPNRFDSRSRAKHGPVSAKKLPAGYHGSQNFENPMHPYEYLGRIEDYGGTYRIGPRSLGGIEKWSRFHKFNVSNLREVLRETRPGGERMWENGPRRMYIVKQFRKKYLQTMKNARRIEVEEYEQAWRDGAIYSQKFEDTKRRLGGNPMTPEEKREVLKVAAEHEKDALEHKSVELRQFDAGTAAGLKEAVAISENPREPKGFPESYAYWHEVFSSLTNNQLALVQRDFEKDPARFTDYPAVEGIIARVITDEIKKRGLHKNPHDTEAELIGTDCLAMEYMDVPKARREGVQNPQRPWRHDFTVKGAKIWGLSDGSVLVKAPRPLWRKQPNSVTGK